MNETKAAPTLKRFKMPHVLAFLFCMTLVVVALTWIIPAGEYATQCPRTNL